MKTMISRRGLVRLVSFSLAIIAVLAAANIMYMRELGLRKMYMQAGYSSAIESLAQSADQISAVLTKGRYASSPAMMTKLSNKLMEESGAAKSALEALPVSDLRIDGLEKFLSQIGNYADSLSRRATAGEKISDKDVENVAKLAECADKLKESLWQLRSKVLSSDYDIEELFDGMDTDVGSFLSDGISGIEDNFSDMPKLIYDGPFSDHILERKPRLTEGAKEVSEEKALEKAAAALDVESYRVAHCDVDEEGRMPSYCFYCEGGRCAVTKNGGYLVYCLKSRNVTTSEMTPEEAAKKAEAYLNALGIEDMEMTYYETYNNVTTFNFAYSDGDAIYYTDLIKVAVALDNGEVLGFDARGYIVNHTERDFGDPEISEEDAKDGVSDILTVESCRLAVIPTDSVKEKLCYELKCSSDDDKDVLVYVNAQTGDEEEILILLTMDQGVLTV